MRRLPIVTHSGPDASLRLDFAAKLRESGHSTLRATGVDVLQVNVGKLCNQRCRHCHVDAGPDRHEVMSPALIERCLEVLREGQIGTLDITGGAPELNPSYPRLVEGAFALGCHIMTRCNLTVLELPRFRGLARFFAEHRVEVVSSLPHYGALNTDRQRGEGVFEKSIRALKRLNAEGYADGRSGLRLALVTNPVGAFLPGDQEALESHWRERLWRDHGIVFDALYCITNMPVGRYLDWLGESGNLETYLAELVQAYNPRAVDGLMCRKTLSVSWDGQLYDCDFNQMLTLPLRGVSTGLMDVEVARLKNREIAVGPHCFGCTAGAGSSCGGVTVTTAV